MVGRNDTRICATFHLFEEAFDVNVCYCGVGVVEFDGLLVGADHLLYLKTF